MSITQSLYGTNRIVPERGEKNWGTEVTSLTVDVLKGLDGISQILGSISTLKFPSTSSSLASSATLTQSHPAHLVTGSGGAISLDTTTPITASSVNGLLVLIGTSDTNTVTVPDSGTCAGLNGECVLGENDCLVLVYNTTQAVWIEVTRNN